MVDARDARDNGWTGMPGVGEGRRGLGLAVAGAALLACASPSEPGTDESQVGPSQSAEESSQSATGEAGCELGFEVGDCPPDFAMPDTLGEDTRLFDFRGDVVLIASEALW